MLQTTFIYCAVVFLVNEYLCIDTLCSPGAAQPLPRELGASWPRTTSRPEQSNRNSGLVPSAVERPCSIAFTMEAWRLFLFSIIVLVFEWIVSQVCGLWWRSALFHARLCCAHHCHHSTGTGTLHFAPTGKRQRCVLIFVQRKWIWAFLTRGDFGFNVRAKYTWIMIWSTNLYACVVFRPSPFLKRRRRTFTLTCWMT